MTHEETIEDLRRQLADARAVNAQAEIVRDENERLRAELRKLKAAAPTENTREKAERWALVYTTIVGMRWSELTEAERMVEIDAMMTLVREARGEVNVFLRA